MNLTKCVKRNNEFGRPGWLIQFPYDQLFLNDEFKDSIDAGFRQWLPEKKAWWVDESCGEWLQQLFENWNQPIVKRQVKPPCSICNGTGLVSSPALGKFSGKPIPNCFTRCECNPEESESYHRIIPADFDFPISWDFHRWACQTYGNGDPGPDRSQEEQHPEPTRTVDRIVYHHITEKRAENERDIAAAKVRQKRAGYKGIEENVSHDRIH